MIYVGDTHNFEVELEGGRTIIKVGVLGYESVFSLLNFKCYIIRAIIIHTIILDCCGNIGERIFYTMINVKLFYLHNIILIQ